MVTTIEDIEALLPHRKPFLFVDEIIRADDEGSESRYTFKRIPRVRKKSLERNCIYIKLTEF